MSERKRKNIPKRFEEHDKRPLLVMSKGLEDWDSYSLFTARVQAQNSKERGVAPKTGARGCVARRSLYLRACGYDAVVQAGGIKEVVISAEQNLIIQSGLFGEPLEGAYVYCTSMPRIEDCVSLIQCEIAKIVIGKEVNELIRRELIDMFEENGIEVLFLTLKEKEKHGTWLGE